MSLSIAAAKDIDQALEILSAKPGKAMKDFIAEEPEGTDRFLYDFQDAFINYACYYRFDPYRDTQFENGSPIPKRTKSMMWRRSASRVRRALSFSCALTIFRKKSVQNGPSGWCGTASSPTLSRTRATARSFGCPNKRRTGGSGPSISARPPTI